MINKLLKKFCETPFGYEMSYLFPFLNKYRFLLEKSEESFRKYGEYFGYKPCCTEFVLNCKRNGINASEVHDKYQIAPWVGCYIPCKECADKYYDNFEEVIEYIKQNRKCPIPFPGEFYLIDTIEHSKMYFNSLFRKERYNQFIKMIEDYQANTELKTASDNYLASKEKYWKKANIFNMYSNRFKKLDKEN